MSEMTSALSSREAEIEEIRREHLAFDPRPSAELNRMSMEAMQRTGWEYWVPIAILAIISIGGFFGGWIFQIWWGLGVAGVRRPSYWGIYIISFVFWIGISHSGTFVSAVLRVFKAEFRRPITRAAEMMTSTSILVAVAMLGVDIGRTWRGYWIVPYPNQRQIWPNFHSPFLWDEFAILTYLTGSTLYLFLPLIPDLAMAREHSSGWRHKLYRILSLGWRGTEREWRHLQMAISIFSFVIIPVMFSVHTIVSWDFAMTKVLGWRSSIFGPYFVVGAIYSGVSAVVIVLTLIRYNMRMAYFVRKEHFSALAKLILVFSFAWTYFFFNDYIVSWYPGDLGEKNMLNMLVRGEVAPFFWAMVVFNIVIPWLTLWNKKVRTTPALLMPVCVGINIGMFLERYIIVTGMTRINRLPFNWGTFQPSLTEIAIGVGALATFFLLYGLLSRLVPLIPLWEVREAQITHKIEKMGRSVVTTIRNME